MATEVPSRGPTTEARAFIGLGANLGEAASTVLRAIEAIGAIPSTRVLNRSSLYRSVPVDAQGPDFINAVVEVATRLQADELLRELQAIERREGRERPYRNAPRTLDLDLLLHGDARIESESLTLPHPRMHERAFVLQPLSQIAPERVTPEQLAGVAAQAITRLPGT